MKAVDLTPQKFRKIPGYSTKLSVGTWRGKIDGMLYDLGVKRKAWMTDEDGTELLMFELEVTIGNVTKRLAFRFEPVMIRVKKRRTGGRSPVVFEPQPKASWKLFHDLMQRKIAAVSLGIVSAHHEFMPYISKTLPDGREGTFADFMDMVIVEGDLDQLALEDRGREEEKKKAIEVPYREEP